MVPMFLTVVQRDRMKRNNLGRSKGSSKSVFITYVCSVDFSVLFRKEALHTFTLLEFCQSPVFTGQHLLKCHLSVHKLTNIFFKNATFFEGVFGDIQEDSIGLKIMVIIANLCYFYVVCPKYVMHCPL